MKMGSFLSLFFFPQGFFLTLASVSSGLIIIDKFMVCIQISEKLLYDNVHY